MATNILTNEIKQDEALSSSDQIGGSIPTVVPTTTVSDNPTLGPLIHGDLLSSNFVTGSTGWRIRANGNVEFSDGTFRGALSAATIDIGGADATSFHVDIDGNLWSGAATFNIATNPFAVSNAGVLRAVSGTIGGWTLGATTLVGGNITLDQANDRITVGATNGIVINGATSEITSNDGVAWKINGDGTLTGFNNFVPNANSGTTIWRTQEVQLPYNTGTTGQESCGWTIPNNSPSGQQKDAFGVQYSGFNSSIATITAGSMGNNNLLWNSGKDFKIKFSGAIDTGGTADDRFAFGFSDTNTSFSSETATANSVKFVWRNVAGTRTLYTITSDGTVNSNSTTAYTFTDMHLYQIDWNDAANVRFYIDGTLLFTHTTNIPTAANTLSLKFGNNSLNASVDLGQVVMSIEL